MANVSFPALNLSEIVVILKTEGGYEFALIAKEFFKDSKVFDSWGNIIKILEHDIIPVLSKGGDISSIRSCLKVLETEAKFLIDAFTAAGSFIPGPIGIVCSLIQAIACFCSGNIPMGLLELLGCIPGAKFATTGGSKVAQKIGNQLMKVLKENGNFEKHYSYAQLLLGGSSKFNSSFIIDKLNELRKVAGNATTVGAFKCHEMTTYNIVERNVTKFGSLLMPWLK